MSPYLFLAFCLGAIAVILVCLSYYIRHACDDLSCPDVHGDYPAIPPDLIEKARVDARLRDLAFHDATTVGRN
jgi:hypothetical protein